MFFDFPEVVDYFYAGLIVGASLTGMWVLYYVAKRL